MAVGNFFYNQQLKRYMAQFAAIFSEMQVIVGKNDARDSSLLNVPIIFAPYDRVAAAAVTGHTQNRHLRLPMMSVDLTSIAPAADRRKGTDTVARDVVLPLGGVLPNDARVVRQLMPIPYDLTMNLHIFTSNQDNMFQILEQILTLFNPSLSIQTSDAPLDWTRMVTVELVDISNEVSPGGIEQKLQAYTLAFKIDAYLSIPATVRNDLVRHVIARVSAVTGDIGTIYGTGSENGEIGDIFDQQGVDQIILQSVDDVT